MLQTLYKTADPLGPAINAEFYELVIEPGLAGGRRVFFAKEKHGWWNEAEKRPLSLVNTLCPEDGLATYDEALTVYQAQVRKRVSEGFVHSFSPDFYGGDPQRFRYEYLGKV